MNTLESTFHLKKRESFFFHYKASYWFILVLMFPLIAQKYHSNAKSPKGNSLCFQFLLSPVVIAHCLAHPRFPENLYYMKGKGEWRRKQEEVVSCFSPHMVIQHLCDTVTCDDSWRVGWSQPFSVSLDFHLRKLKY